MYSVAQFLATAINGKWDMTMMVNAPMLTPVCKLFSCDDTQLVVAYHDNKLT